MYIYFAGAIENFDKRYYLLKSTRHAQTLEIKKYNVYINNIIVMLQYNIDSD